MPNIKYTKRKNTATDHKSKSQKPEFTHSELQEEMESAQDKGNRMARRKVTVTQSKRKRKPERNINCDSTSVSEKQNIVVQNQRHIIKKQQSETLKSSKASASLSHSNRVQDAESYYSSKEGSSISESSKHTKLKQRAVMHSKKKQMRKPYKATSAVAPADTSVDREDSQASVLVPVSKSQVQHHSKSRSNSNPYFFETNYDSSDDLVTCSQLEMKTCTITGKRLAACKPISSKTREFTDSLIDLGVGFVLNKNSKRRHYKDVEKLMTQVQAKLEKKLDVLKAPESDIVDYEKLHDELVGSEEECNKLCAIETRLVQAVENEEERVFDDESSQDGNRQYGIKSNKVNPLLTGKYEEELCLPQFYNK